MQTWAGLGLRDATQDLVGGKPTEDSGQLVLSEPARNHLGALISHGISKSSLCWMPVRPAWGHLGAMLGPCWETSGHLETMLSHLGASNICENANMIVYRSNNAIIAKTILLYDSGALRDELRRRKTKS